MGGHIELGHDPYAAIGGLGDEPPHHGLAVEARLPAAGVRRQVCRLGAARLAEGGLAVQLREPGVITQCAAAGLTVEAKVLAL